MSGRGPMGVGLIGAGNIGHSYLSSLTTYPDVRVLAVGARDISRATEHAEPYGLPAVTIDQLLANPAIELVLNLTPPAVHADVSTAILQAGKHVWTEKPLATTREAARALGVLAAETGLRIGVAPDTVLGGGLQHGRRLIQSGRIGAPLFAQTTYQWQGPELFHPDPAFYYADGGGPLLDIGPYYVSALVHLLGPVAAVTATAARPSQSRQVLVGDQAGTSFPVEVPTTISALLKFESGATAQSFFSFDTPLFRQGVFEVTGRTGTAILPSPVEFDGTTRIVTPIDQLIDWPPTPLDEPFPQDAPTTDRGIGVVDMARAIRADRPHSASAELGFHVLDVLLNIHDAARTQQWRTVASTVETPAPLPIDFDPRLSTLTDAFADA